MIKFSSSSSLKTQVSFLVFSFISLVTALILLFSIFLIFQFYRSLRDVIISDNLFKVESLAKTAKTSFILEDKKNLEDLGNIYIKEGIVGVMFCKPSGEVVVETGSKISLEKNVLNWVTKTKETSYASFVVDRKSCYIFSSPILIQSTAEIETGGVESTTIGGFVTIVLSKNVIYSRFVRILLFNLIFLAILLILVIRITLSYLNKNIVKPIIYVSDAFSKISKEKDLSLTIELKNKGGIEISSLASAANDMLSSFKNIILAITKTAGVVGDATSNIFQSIQQQTQNVQQVTTTVSQVSNSMSNISQAAQNISNLLIQVNNVTTQGKQNVADTSTKIESIYSALNVALTQSQELGKKSQAIGEIVGMITKIADQTNLLSLNAAIEAARAGEAGRGFAVVADEIRKLAETSSQQAQKISQILNEIVSGIDVSVKSTQELLNQATEAVRLTNHTSKLFLDIAEMINKSSTNMEQVASLVEETSAAAQEVAASIEEQSAATEEVSAQSSKLAEIVEELKKQIQQFKV